MPHVTVESAMTVESGTQLPYVVAQASPPFSVKNGPIEAGMRFIMYAACYSADRMEALAIAEQAYMGVVRLWRDNFEAESGWISRVLPTSNGPFLVTSQMETDDVWRFDVSLDVIVRSRL